MTVTRCFTIFSLLFLVGNRCLLFDGAVYSALLLSVSVPVKIQKQKQEEDFVRSDPPAQSDGEIAIDKGQLEAMDGDGNKLNDLERRKVLLPAEIFLILGSKCGHKIIKVHDDMHQRVDESEEASMTARRVAKSRPQTHRQDAVVDDVENGHLVGFLAQHKENRVEKVDEFRDVEPPADVNHAESSLVVGVVNRLADEAVFAAEPSIAAHLIKHPAIKEDLEEVVDEQHAS